MSLFGGEESVAEALPPRPEDDSDSPGPSSPGIEDPQFAQDTRQLSSSLSYQDDADADDDDDEEDEYYIVDDEEPRPNRFHGKASTWRGYTAADRQIAAALDQVQSGDLAAHLYNAHALKQRVLLPSTDLTEVRNYQGKDLWRKRGKDLEHVDIAGENQTDLIPHKRWTAWPLPPGEPPASHEKFYSRTTHTERGGWGIPSEGQRRVGEELREELLAVFLQQARAKWEARESEDESHDESIRQPRKRPRTGSIRSPSSTSGIEQHDSENPSQDSDGVKRSRSRVTDQSDSESKWANVIGSRRRTKRQEAPPGKIAILADDDKARRILQPTINSLLTQLDEVAANIRRSRLNHFGRGAHSDTSGSEVPSDAESLMSQRGTRSKSRAQSTRQRAKSTSKPQNPSRARAMKRKTTSQRAHDSDSVLDNAIEQDPQTEDEHSSNSNADAKGISRTRRSSTDSLMNREASAQVGLMDWSEVLGIASMSGWNPNAISRAAQRCATLFGESMTFREFDEGLATGPIPPPVAYTPSTIPGSDILGVSESSSPKRPLFDVGSLRCPHEDCPRHNLEYKIPYRVIEHLQRVHGYDPRTNDSDTEDRKVGAVHKDGFLAPVTAKQGWLGLKRSKSRGESEVRQGKRRGRKAKEESESVPMSAVQSPIQGSPAPLESS